MRINEAIQQKIVIYPGRFHPFHKGHASVFHFLKEKYGQVFISTSDKVDPPKSPFSFAEKKQMMIHAGVPSSAVVQTKNPYQAVEILQKHDPENTIAIFAISEKDMDEDPRFSFKPKKDGSPSYFQPLAGQETLMPLSKHGYITTVPTLDFTVLGEPMRSATELRRNFAKADKQTQKQMIVDLYGTYDPKVHNIMANKITEWVSLGKSDPSMSTADPEEEGYDKINIPKIGDPKYGHLVFGGNKGVAVKAYKRLNHVIDGLKALNAQEPLDRETKRYILQQITAIREKLNTMQIESRMYKAWNILKEEERPDFNLTDLHPSLRPLVRQAMVKFPMAKDKISAVVRMLQQDMERTKGVNKEIGRLDTVNDVQDVEIDSTEVDVNDLEARVVKLEKSKFESRMHEAWQSVKEVAGTPVKPKTPPAPAPKPKAPVTPTAPEPAAPVAQDPAATATPKPAAPVAQEPAAPVDPKADKSRYNPFSQNFQQKQMGVKDLSGKTIPGGMQKNKKYAFTGDNYIDKSREANPNAPKGTKDPWTRYHSKDVEQTNIGSGEKTMVPDSPDNQTQMDVAKLELDDPELVKRGLNMVAIEVDQNGMGLTFGTQADLTAINRQKRRQAYQDHLAGDVTKVDFSQYSPEEMAQIEADAKMNTKAFGNAILDQMEKTTGIKQPEIDREAVNRGEGGIGWTTPAAEHGRRQGEKAYKKRIEKYRNASIEDKARMRKFDPYNKKYDEIEKEQGVTVPNPEKDRKEKISKKWKARRAAEQ